MSRILSFKHAIAGIFELFRSETNAKIHLVVTVAVITMGFVVNLNKYEWSLIVLSIGMVIAFEGINTSLETLCDYVTEEKNESIRKTKDIAAATVLISAIVAATVGIIIFLPYLV